MIVDKKMQRKTYKHSDWKVTWFLEAANEKKIWKQNYTLVYKQLIFQLSLNAMKYYLAPDSAPYSKI